MKLFNKTTLVFLLVSFLVLAGCSFQPTPIDPPGAQLNVLQVEHNVSDDNLISLESEITRPSEGRHRFRSSESVSLSYGMGFDNSFIITSWDVFGLRGGFVKTVDVNYELLMDRDYKVVANIVCKTDDACLEGYSCLNNKCVVSDQEFSCSSTDGGLNVFERGTTSNETHSFTDSCDQAGWYVKEYYCHGNNIVYDEIHCLTNSAGRCLNGACVDMKNYCENLDGSTSADIPLERNFIFLDDEGNINSFNTKSSVIGSLTTPKGNILTSGNDVVYNSFLGGVVESSKDRYIVVFEDTKSLAQIRSEALVKQKSQSDINMLTSRTMSDISSKSLQVNNYLSNGRVLDTYKTLISGVLVEADELEVEKLQKMPNVRVYPDRKVYVNLMDSISQISADLVHEIVDSNGDFLTGKGVTIAVLDTGVDHNHPDLGGCLGTGCKVIESIDFTGTVASGLGVDDHGHGTHVAATIAGDGFLRGVAPDASIISYKVLGANGGGSSSDIIAAIERAADPNQDGSFEDAIDIISLSLGAPYGSSDDPMALAIDNVVSLGVIAVIGAGNDGQHQSVGTPGTARSAITVGAIDKQDSLAWFSSKGPTTDYVRKPDLSAPGVDICAAQWNGWLDSHNCSDQEEHIAISGTSMATPHVSGVAALLLQQKPDLNPEEVKSILMQSSSPVNRDHTLNYELSYGAGVVDALRAINTDVIVSPSSIDLQNSELEVVEFSVNVSNLGDSPRVLVFEDLQTFNFNTNNPGEISLDTYQTSCIMPGEKEQATLTFEFTSNDLENKGFSSGNLKLKEYDCDLEDLIDERSMVFSNKNFYEIDITIIPYLEEGVENTGFLYFLDMNTKDFILQDMFWDYKEFETRYFLPKVDDVGVFFRSYTFNRTDNPVFSSIIYSSLAAYSLEDKKMIIDERNREQIEYHLPEDLVMTDIASSGVGLHVGDVSFSSTNYPSPNSCARDHRFYILDGSIYDMISGAQHRILPYMNAFSSPKSYFLSSTSNDAEIIFNDSFNNYTFNYGTELLRTNKDVLISGFTPLPENYSGAAVASAYSGDSIGANTEGLVKEVFLSDEYGDIFTFTSLNSYSKKSNQYLNSYNYYQRYFGSLEDLNFFKDILFEPKMIVLKEDGFGSINRTIRTILPSNSIGSVYLRIFSHINHEDELISYHIESPTGVFEGEQLNAVFINCFGSGSSYPSGISCVPGTYKITQNFENFDPRLSESYDEFCWTGEKWLEGVCN